MKYLVAFILTFVLLGESYAGLFEYTMGEKTRINSTSYESADVLESIQIPNNSYSYSNTNFSNYNYSNSKHSNQVKPTIFADDYYRDNNISNAYYNTSEIVKEMKYYIVLANGLRRDISKIRNYGSEFIPLRNQLERDLSDLENQIDYLSDLRSSIAQSNNYNNHTYYYYNENQIRSQRLINYYRKYGYEYNNSSYYYYDANYDYYQRKPEWLNENLRPRDEGYIYIQ